MKIKLVTAYWMDEVGLPFLGAPTYRKERYLGGIIAYCQNVDLPVVCYTHKKSLHEVLRIKNEFNLQNLQIKVMELSEVKFHNEIQEIVNNDTKKYLRELDGRGCEIMWGKFEILQRELSDCDRLYWLDAGLPHPGIFTWRYSKIYNKIEDHKNPSDLNGWWSIYDTYNYKYFFNTETFLGLSEKSDNKIVLITSHGAQISYPFQELGLIPEPFKKPYPVGAMIGGDSKTVKLYVDLFWKYASKLIDAKVLSTEECLMKPALDDMRNDQVLTFEFTNWYCGEHDKFHFEMWDETWQEPKPFYMAWEDLINYVKKNDI